MKKVFFITLFFFSFSTLFSSEVKKSTLKEQLESLNKLWKTKNDYIFFLNEKTHLKSEVELIQLHLSLVEKHLRKEKVNHLSFEQKENRIKCLNILNLYCKQGVFPKNIYHKERTPYFIDPLGTPCAVGKLIISTGFESFAKTIASENNYGYVKDLNIQYSELSQWAKTNGFKIEELAWIQPTYASDPKYYPMSCNTSCTPTGTQVTSSFIAPDSIISKYKTDAEQIALRWIYANNINYKDSLHIPKQYIDTVLNALIAVYNATPNFSPRDTIVKMIEIHAKRDSTPSIHDFFITTDGTLTWLETLKNGSLLSGNAIMDSLVFKYGVTYIERFNHYSWDKNPNAYTYRFRTDKGYNIKILTKDIPAISGVIKVAQYYERSSWGYEESYGMDIKDFEIHPDHVQITYFYNWGCKMFPCNYKTYSSIGRSWVFNIYNDGIVEFVSSYGSPLNVLTYPMSIEPATSSSISIFPNPFNNQINIDGLTSDKFNYSILNTLGEEILSGQSSDNQIDELDVLPNGPYFLKITSNNTVISKLIIRK